MKFIINHLKLFFIALFFIFISNLYSQDIPRVIITGNCNHLNVEELLDFIEKNYQVKFYYKKSWFEEDSLTYSCNNIYLSNIIDKIAQGNNLVVQVVQLDNIIFMPKEQVRALTGNYTELINDNKDQGIITVGGSIPAAKNKKVKVTGIIKNGKTGEPVIGANIQIENTTNGSITDPFGNFVLEVTPGIHTFLVSGVGYEKMIYKVNVINKGNVDLELFEELVEIEDLSIYARRKDDNVKGNQMSYVNMDSKIIKHLPSLTGEKDVLKGFTMMPGVKSVGEFGSGINVRGGGEDQNLYLIEGAPLFNTSHVFGLISVLNPDVVKNVSLYKGQSSAEYGERVSSVVDIKVNDPGIKKFKSIGGIGLYNARLLFEVPIIKENLSLKIGGRTSYSSYLLKRLQDYNLRNSEASFYDANGLLNWNLKKARVSIHGYISEDNFNYSNEQQYTYGNKLMSFQWLKFFGSLHSDLLLSYSRYDAAKENIASEYERTRKEKFLEYASFKYKLKYNGKKHSPLAGFQIIRYNNSPGHEIPIGISLIPAVKLDPEIGYEGAFFIGHEYNLSKRISINASARFSFYALVGPYTKYEYLNQSPVIFRDPIGKENFSANEIVQTYDGIEPRASIKFMLSGKSSLKASYNRNFQYISLLSYSALYLPTDIWKLSDPYQKPIQSDQLALGYFRNNEDNSIEMSLELYYKEMDHLPEYINNAKLDINPNLETELLDAKGENYGVELMLKKNSGKVDGWLSYTYSRAYNQTSGEFFVERINSNEPYPSSYDKPHDLTIVSNFHVNKRLCFGVNFSYATGRAVSFPEYSYTAQPGDFGAGDDIAVYLSRNKYRLPDYHRLDLSMSLYESLKKSKKWKGSWTFSILNVYGRKNAYSAFYKKEEPTYSNDYRRFSIYKMVIIGRPIPTLTYNFVF